MAYRIDSWPLKEQKITACFSKTKRLFFRLQHIKHQLIDFLNVLIFTLKFQVF